MAERKTAKTKTTKKRFLTMEQMKKQNEALYKKLTKEQKEALDRTCK